MYQHKRIRVQYGEDFIGFNTELRNHLKEWTENIMKVDTITSGTSYNTVCQ